MNPWFIFLIFAACILSIIFMFNKLSEKTKNAKNRIRYEIVLEVLYFLFFIFISVVAVCILSGGLKLIS